MDKTTGIVLVVGVLVIAAYLVVSSTSDSGSSSSDFCNGDWTDYFNPLCWGSSVLSGATTEVNTILIIVAAVIIIVVGLLAFSPSGGAIAGHASRAFL